MTTKTKKIAKWKLYSLLIAGISIGWIGFTVATVFAAYPTEGHRQTSHKLTEMTQKAASDEKAFTKLQNSQEYKDLESSTNNLYSTRMSIGAGVLNLVLSIAIVVAIYRYLRRNRITTKPVSVTVWINVAVLIITAVPTFYLSQLLSGASIDALTMILLLVAVPFAILFEALVVFLVAKIAEWYYSRAHGFVD